MRLVGAAVARDDLGVDGDFDAARLRRPTAQHDPAHLGVLVRGDDDFAGRLDAAVAPADGHRSGSGARIERAAGRSDRRMAERPDLPRVEVAQVDEHAVLVDEAIAGPARDGDPSVLRKARAGAGDGRPVTSVREDPHVRSAVVQPRRRGRLAAEERGERGFQVPCQPLRRPVAGRRGRVDFVIRRGFVLVVHVDSPVRAYTGRSRSPVVGPPEPKRPRPSPRRRRSSPTPLPVRTARRPRSRRRAL